ncbi:MAG: hypothetical protein U1F98_09950 [Verrucomicrobiota bacterium]
MTELEVLYLVLAGVYAWECVCWLPSAAFAATTWFGQRWRPRMPNSLAGNSNGGLVLAPPLPPLGWLAQCSPFSIFTSTDGAVLQFHAPPGTRNAPPPVRVSWTETDSLSASGRTVSIAGKKRFKAASPAAARRAVRNLRRLRELSPAERDAFQSATLRTGFDEQELGARWQRFLEFGPALRAWCNALFLLLFAAGPLAVHLFGLGRTWPWILAAWIILAAGITWRFRKAHRALYPEPSADEERFMHGLTIALSPASAVRAHDLLSRGVLDAFHPLALVQAFCNEQDFHRHAEQWWIDACFPVATTPGADASTRAVLDKFLRRHGINPTEFLKPPTRSDPSSRSYCPRCRAQYIRKDGTCPDCSGVRLVPFP